MKVKQNRKRCESFSNTNNFRQKFFKIKAADNHAEGNKKKIR